MDSHPDCFDHTDGYPWDCACWRKAPIPKVGSRVRVHPGQGQGLSYEAIVEEIGGDNAKVRPVGVALTKPAWAGSVRARRVGLIRLEILPTRQEEPPHA